MIALIALLAAVGAQASSPIHAENATIEEFPSVVAVEYNGIFKCGGVIVGKTNILTAAQCAERLVSQNMKTRIGSTQNLQGGELYDVYNVTYFPLVEKTKEFDVAILTLVEAIRFGASVQPATLVADGKEPTSGEPLTLVGWGINGQSEVLKKINLPSTEKDACHRTLETDLNIKITNSMICAGENVQQHYSFKGETGGPLYNAKKELVGIASWDIPTTNLDYPKAFNNIANNHINEFVRKFALQ